MHIVLLDGSELAENGLTNKNCRMLRKIWHREMEVLFIEVGGDDLDKSNLRSKLVEQLYANNLSFLRVDTMRSADADGLGDYDVVIVSSLGGAKSDVLDMPIMRIARGA